MRKLRDNQANLVISVKDALRAEDAKIVNEPHSLIWFSTTDTS